MWDAVGKQQGISEKKDSNVRVIAVVHSVGGEMREKTVVSGCVFKGGMLCFMMQIGIKNETQLIGQQI